MKDQRSRLIDIVSNVYSPIMSGDCTTGVRRVSPYLARDIVDQLLSEGVVLPPCKVGDTVYFKDGRKGVVTSFYCCDNPDAGNLWISIDKRGRRDNVFRTNVCVSDFGVNVFLNPDEVRCEV